MSSLVYGTELDVVVRCLKSADNEACCLVSCKVNVKLGVTLSSEAVSRKSCLYMVSLRKAVCYDSVVNVTAQDGRVVNERCRIVHCCSIDLVIARKHFWTKC